MAASLLSVYVDDNNYVYAHSWDYYLISEDELQYIVNSTLSGFYGEIREDRCQNALKGNSATPQNPLLMTQEQYNQIQAGTFHYGPSAPLSRQPVLTYNLTWGTGNIFQRLSGKTYVNPSGQTVDCSSVSVTFSSSKHFKKFYATAVKSGNDYGFENDILVDIRQTNPTGVLLYELTERDANVDFSFTINTSSLASGDGEYRIGLYVQDDDGVWNYEYFLLEANNLQLEGSNNLLLQVPVQCNFSYDSGPQIPEGFYPLCVDIQNKVFFLFDPQNQQVFNSLGCSWYQGIQQDPQIVYNAILDYCQHYESIINNIFYLSSNDFYSLMNNGFHFEIISYTISTFQSYHQVPDTNNFGSFCMNSYTGIAGYPIFVIFPQD